MSKKGTSLLVDSNQRLNDQGFIDLEQPQIFRSACPPFLERDFLKKFFCKNMNSVSHPVGSRVSKNVVLTCAEIYSCIISEAVLNR